MSFREKLEYLHNELEGLQEIHRSISPSRLITKSPRRSSRSPRSSMSAPQQQQHDSRPDIAAWPAPPPQNALGKLPHYSKGPLTTSTGTSPIPETHFHTSSTFDEDSSKLLSMLMSTGSNQGAIRGRESELRRNKMSCAQTFGYHEYVSERERKLETEYSNKIIALSEEVLGAKKDFEARMKIFWEQFNREKETALENLRQEHQKEIEMLERRVAGSQLLNLEQKYIIEIRRLEDERKSLKVERERLVETFDMKLRRAQSLYETQLSTAKALYSKELDTLRNHEENLKEELTARHEEFRDRVQELKLQSRQSREEVSACKTEITLLQKKLTQKQSELEGITKELETARIELISSIRKLREMDIRYAKTFDELSQKETELNKKAELLDAAESSRERVEATIKKLQTEVRGLKNKVDFLEIERDNLQCQRESQTHLQTSQINTLEAVLESVTKEKETSKEHYEKLLEQADSREQSLRKELSTKFNELEVQYNALKDYVNESGDFGPESAKMLEEVGMLRAQKNYLEDEIANLHAQLADDKQKVREESSTSFYYMTDVSKAVDSIRKNVQDNMTAQSSKMSENVNTLDSDLQRKLKDPSTQPTNEMHLVLNKLIQVEKDVQTIIIEKNETKSKLERLEEENRTLSQRLNESKQDELLQVKNNYEKVMHQLENEKNRTNQLQSKLNKKEADADQEQKVVELNENLKLADRKNKILMELIEYQKGPIDNEVDELLSEIGTEDISQEELHQTFEKYDKLKKPEKVVETRNAETKPKPQVREMSLQTNIEIKRVPSQQEELQKEIVGMLANLMNGRADEYSDLLELKKILMSASDSASSSDEPESPQGSQACHKAVNKLQSLVSNMSDQREKKYKSDRKDEQMETSRSRSPSLMSRTRERTPSKMTSSSSTTMDQSLSSSRNFAYPAELTMDPKRKKTSSLNKPAWKF